MSRHPKDEAVDSARQLLKIAEESTSADHKLTLLEEAKHLISPFNLRLDDLKSYPPGVTVVTALLDETGSMLGARDETIRGYNAFLDGLRQDPSLCFLSRLHFDRHVTGPDVRIHDDAALLSQATQLTHENYNPRGYTPLFDAIGEAIYHTDKVIRNRFANKIVIMIQTDGLENCSREFTHAKITDLINQKKKLKWEFIFMGADLKEAAYTAASSFGIAAASTVAYNKANTYDAFYNLATVTNSYRSGASAQTVFTQEQKSNMGDNTVNPKTNEDGKDTKPSV